MTTQIEKEAASGQPSVAPPVGTRSKAAFRRRVAEIQAVPDEALAHITVDAHTAVSTVLGALPGIRPLREKMGVLPGLRAALVEGLEDFAWAVSEANGRREHAMAPAEDLGPLLDEAMKMRKTLRLDAVSLAHRGFIEKERLAAFRGLTGFKNVAFDLIDWALVMRECWPRVQGKSGLTVEEVEAASRLGERLLAAASLREQRRKRVDEATRLRARALTLLLDAYDEVRRAITYLRWNEDDIDTIAPSLFLKNGRRTKPVDDPAPAPGPKPVNPAPAAAVTQTTAVTQADPPPPPGIPRTNMLLD